MRRILLAILVLVVTSLPAVAVAQSVLAKTASPGSRNIWVINGIRFHCPNAEFPHSCGPIQRRSTSPSFTTFSATTPAGP